ncbi:transcription elongation factor GreB [Balneicella halophila]|uniref:Transcription elongation factor GreB n=1 Tax=Balneicella halophila TaxID=1537566 RepID=A0A7L4URB1_BALHA|nr:GreA/GreB family elongation factor [Balneicella halophila]PVX50849.1 transcription elongation factor GreB [Balneicella halophila]
MSRGFVKESDQEEVPLVVPRAPIPNGVTNYVTPNGLEELEEEQKQLIAKREKLKTENAEKNRVQINHIRANLDLLVKRINSAIVIDLENQPKDTVHFGATVTICMEDDSDEQHYQIVGVDEADISKNKVSFLSPIARVLMNKKVGDQFNLKTPKSDRAMKVKAIE